jgi:integrase
LTKPLTAAAVAKYRPGPSRRIIRDGGARSLYLVVTENGAKSWMMRFRRPDGKPAKIVLGPVDMSGRELDGAPEVGMPLTLSAARALAADIHRQRAQGKDVIGDYKTARHRQRAKLQERNGNTFTQAARDYLAHHRLRKNGQRPRRWRESARLLGLDYADETSAEGEIIRGGLAEKWGDRDVRDLDDHDIWSVVQDAKERGIPGLEVRNKNRSEARAGHLFSALSSLFGWLRRERRVTANPCREMDRPAASAERDRYLDKNEIRYFWKANESVGEPFGAIFKLLLLSGQRLNEVAGMRWSELSDDRAIWNLPGKRTKNGYAHTVPLPTTARQLIAAAPRKKGADLVFTTTGTTPVSGWSRVKRRLDAAMLALAKSEKGTIELWRLHDLRRTAVTGMVELGVPPHVVELVVNHVSGTRGGVAGIYNKSEMLPERKAALERWAAHVSGLVGGTGDNVVTLHPRGGAA